MDPNAKRKRNNEIRKGGCGVVRCVEFDVMQER